MNCSYYLILLYQLIVWAPTREKAIERMKRALDETIIRGWCIIIQLRSYFRLMLCICFFLYLSLERARIRSFQGSKWRSNPLFWLIGSFLILYVNIYIHIYFLNLYTFSCLEGKNGKRISCFFLNCWHSYNPQDSEWFW